MTNEDRLNGILSKISKIQAETDAERRKAQEGWNRVIADEVARREIFRHIKEDLQKCVKSINERLPNDYRLRIHEPPYFDGPAHRNGSWGVKIWLSFDPEPPSETTSRKCTISVDLKDHISVGLGTKEKSEYRYYSRDTILSPEEIEAVVLDFIEVNI